MPEPMPLAFDLPNMTTLPKPAAAKPVDLRRLPYRRYKPDLERTPERVPTILANAIRECRRAASPWPLFVHGGAGIGKSRAALLFLDWVWNPLYWEMGQLCNDLADAIMHVEKIGETGHGYVMSRDEIWAKWKRADVAVLDEIGTRSRVTDHQFDTIRTALDGREEQPTIYISNCDPGTIGKLYDARIASRLCAGTVVEVVGEDMRLT